MIVSIYQFRAIENPSIIYSSQSQPNYNNINKHIVNRIVNLHFH